MNNREFEAAEVESEEVSLHQVGRTIRRYQGPIRLAMLAIAAALFIGIAVIYLLIPTQRVTTLDFRLAFRGAEKGEYPNGTPFSSTEIVSPTVLNEVFRHGDYAQYLEFDDLKSSLFVVQSNEALQALMRAYRAKLSDPKLTAVDRARIEQEFEEKRASLSKADYSISLANSERISKVPNSIRQKILNDTLATWAEQTVDDKGVSLYDISILSSGVFADVSSPAYDYLVGLDVLRSKINSVIENVDQLLAIPGAKVLRTEKTNRSLAELRTKLSDLTSYRLRPLIGTVASEGISKNPAASLEFLRSQLAFTRLEVQEGQSRVASVRDSLERYMQERKTTSPERSDSAGPTDSIIMDQSFLNRIVELSAEGNDLAYRQRLVDEYRRASIEVVPLESEVRYYEMLLQSFGGRSRAATDAERTLIDGERQAIVAEAVAATNEVNEIYERLSKDLNPSTMLYALNGPVATTNERAVSGSALIVAALVLLMLAFPAVVLVTLIYDRVRGGDDAVVTESEVTDGVSNASHRLARS